MRATSKTNDTKTQTLFFVVLAVFLTLSYVLKTDRVVWPNMPYPPSKTGYVASFLGDEALASRALSVFVQNVGGVGGRIVPIKDYDMEAVAQWMYLGTDLDARSDYLPTMAAYFYGGGSQTSENISPIIDYLAYAGAQPFKRKWFWLWQAVYLAKFKQKDLDKSFVLSQKLANLYDPSMPAWVAQMPAFVLSEQGDKTAAYAIMVDFLQKAIEEGIDPVEVNFAVDFICNSLLDKNAASYDPLCLSLNE